MRVAVVQFAPKIGRVQENLETAQTLCAQLAPRSVDLVCLPEMIFTGYVFPDAKSITPHLEEPGTGPTSRFCAELAKRLRCHVAAGYPERLAPEEAKAILTQEHEGNEVQAVGANSAVLYGPDGQLVGTYRKTSLFTTDMTWAVPGTGFVTFDLPPPLGTVTLAICMDLNPFPPFQWNLDEGPYELATHCIDTRSNLLILLNAWLDSGNEEDEDMDWQTMNYWAARLRPLWVKPLLNGHGDHTRDSHAQPGEDTVVIVCNRCGEENDKTFAGSSSLFSMRRHSGKPKLLAAMGRQEEGVAVWTVPGR
ncbi:carbon-nitrogen hydrolase [Rhodofomes roseus]|uniref:Carbon-nitrogen hydrolase n=1 Tax=Rhodofomes roseus TaxID=34475 RepID=A0ABQ8KRH2_9APHY|nr:carbon-nitrogen hydrolase [Rhodofomes roseus]KAH9841390.1 carbon-nitrogen hydrolase [Rhodofomes roseus]